MLKPPPVAQVQQLFISDLHLCPTRPALDEAFRAFARGPARRAGRLTILGDLFEYWAGDDDIGDAHNAGVIDELAALGEAGVEIEFLRGNRDFLIGEGFAGAAACRLLDDVHLGPVGPYPAALLHGDTLCTADTDYQRFRQMVRSAAWQGPFLAQPLAQRRAAIEALRHQSRDATQAKSSELLDVSPEEVRALFERTGATLMIHGHTHRPARHRLEVGSVQCERWVLADWRDRACWLACEGAGRLSAWTTDEAGLPCPDTRYD